VLRTTGHEGYDHRFGHLVADLEKLVSEKDCGPILIRLSWHDAGKYSNGQLKGGCANAALRLETAKEHSFGANAGLATVALSLLAPIAEKYVPETISNADLWALSANVAIRMMGGPRIPTRVGRIDALSSTESVESQVGRLPDGDKGAAHLRDVFNPKGFDDRAIVALSGAHTVGGAHKDRSGFEGKWTEKPLRFDNSYFKEMLAKNYTFEISPKGLPQHRHAPSGTIMLNSDLALLSEPSMRSLVERYAENQEAWFADFTKYWTKLQELGYESLREVP
jgi:catalase (peroxidase I)